MLKSINYSLHDNLYWIAYQTFKNLTFNIHFLIKTPGINVDAFILNIKYLWYETLKQ